MRQKMNYLSLILVHVMLLTNNCDIFAEILTTNLAELIPDADIRRLVQDFGRLCEGTFLCNLNVSVPDIELTDDGLMIPCCKHCRCDDDCHVTDDCCPDIIPHLLESSEVDRKYDSLIECVQTRYFPKPLSEEFIRSYEMVAKCSSGYTNSDLKGRCERPINLFDDSITDLMTDFTDIVPVTDNDTEVTFKNVYCAACNDIKEDNIIKWGTEVVCTTNPPFLVDYTENLKKALDDRTDCYLQFSLPGTMPTSAAKKACDYLVDRCNMTGLFYPEDPFLKTACASYTSVYKHYKNVHCYLCNGNPEESVEDKCLLPNSGTRIGFEGTFTFDQMPTGITPTNPTDVKCDSDSVYDKHTSTCQPVFCSGVMWLSERRCIPYYTKAYPVSYKIRFRLIPRQDFTGIDSIFSLYDTINQRLSENEYETLEICRLKMLTKLNISESQIEDPVQRQSAAALQIDIDATFFQGDYQKTKVVDELQDVLKVYQTDFTDSNDFIMEHIVDATYIYGKFMEEESVIELKVLPPSISEHFLAYIVNKDDTVSVRNGIGSMDFRCATPIPVSQLQTCAKVVLSNDYFISVLGANLVPEIKVLGEIVETRDVVFTPDKSKMIMCAEQYLYLVENREGQNKPNNIKGDSEEIDVDNPYADKNKPVSHSGKLCAMQVPVLLSLLMEQMKF